MINRSTTQPEYKTLKSTLVISIVAALVLVAGIILLAVAFFGKLQEAVRTAQIIYGVSCIVISSLLFVISTLASDVHFLSYIMQEYTLSSMDSSMYYLI